MLLREGAEFSDLYIYITTGYEAKASCLSVCLSVYVAHLGSNKEPVSMVTEWLNLQNYKLHLG
jgi:hypothetical protein